MKKLFVLLAFLSFPSYAATNKDAEQYIQNLGTQTFQIISNNGLSKDAKQVAIENLFSKNIDYQWMGRFVLGRYWRNLSDTQKSVYLAAYKHYLITHYADKLADFTTGDFSIISSRMNEDGDYIVSTQIKLDQNDSNMDYRIHNTDGSLEIFDITIDGVDFLTTERSEFTSVIDQHGLDYLINQLATMQSQN